MMLIKPHYIHNELVRYLIDITCCTYIGIIFRLNNEDIKILKLWSVTIVGALISSLICYYNIIIYLICFAITWKFFLKHRESDELRYISNTIELSKYIIYDVNDNNDNLLNSIAFVGQWKGKRKYMEDRFIISATNKIYGVVDGHGGEKSSEYISKKFTQIYKKYMNDNSVVDTLKKTFEELESNIIKKHINDGSVVVVTKIDGSKIHCANVGDSEAFIITKKDNIIKLNTSHGISSFPEYCRYTRDIAPVRPRRGRVLRTYSGLMPCRSLGDQKYKNIDLGIINKPDIVTYDFANINDDWKILIIGSDGIWDSVNIEYIRNKLLNILNSNSTDEKTLYPKISDLIINLQERTTKTPDLVDKLSSRYYGDNCTLIIVINMK